MPQRGKQIVVDTDIASSASNVQKLEKRPKQCCDFLIAIKDNNHFIVITDAILEEWKRHRSHFTSTWLTSMYARKLVRIVEVPTDEQLRLKVEQSARDDGKRQAMLKDVHLVEAAMHADKIVASLDETVRLCFHETAATVVVLKHIVWVNPCKDEEQAIEWLERGAEREEKRCLGYHKEQ